MTELYDALENCLEAVERGASIENAVRRHPKLAAELRPLLAAALVARNSSRVHVPLDVRKRGRERLLQRALEAESAGRAAPRRMIPVFPRLALTVTLLVALVLTSTGLVSASSGSLPGQQLYPVKRTWESVRLWFVFAPAERDLLESDYEQERLNEIYELLGKRMEAPIAFSGLLARQIDGNWLISGIPVMVSSSTVLPGTPIADGAPVTVVGMTSADGLVQARQIQVLQPGVALPPLEPSHDGEQASSTGSEGAGAFATPAAPSTPASQSGNPASQPQQVTYQFSGVVQSIKGNVWQINGQTVYVDGADVAVQVGVGSLVKFQGYYSPDGRFNVTSIQSRTGSPDNKHDGGGSGGDSGGGSEGGGDGAGGGDGP